jgi:hypothetical protein
LLVYSSIRLSSLPPQLALESLPSRADIPIEKRGTGELELLAELVMDAERELAEAIHYAAEDGDEEDSSGEQAVTSIPKAVLPH